jgi:hypothetical protein
MNIPMYVILFIYAIFLAVFAVLLLINLYHIIMTASLSAVSFLVSTFFVTLAIVILYTTWWLIKDVNWQQTLISLPDLTNFYRSSL